MHYGSNPARPLWTCIPFRKGLVFCFVDFDLIDRIVVVSPCYSQARTGFVVLKTSTYRSDLFRPPLAQIHQVQTPGKAAFPSALPPFGDRDRDQRSTWSSW